MSRFATKRRHWKYAGLLRSTRRPAGHRAEPVLFNLPAETAAPTNLATDTETAPPVRIFVGTEPLQHRAERIFIWSLIKVRNPARAYQVYLMKDLGGYRRDGWKTAFKTYRYAVPSLAGNAGRAIYNDVDQIYLRDPAEFFDLDMGEHGVLCIDDRDSSVMLMDCARMAEVWREEDAKNEHQHKVFRRRAQTRGLWGPLPPRWHARDTEYVAESSGLLHFTTLHKQPWHPFPKELKYEANEVGDLWHALEREADAAGFTPWCKEQPSEHQLRLYDLYRQMHAQGDAKALEQQPKKNNRNNKTKKKKPAFGGGSLKPHVGVIGELVKRHGPATLLDYGSGKGLVYQDSPEHPAGSRHKVLPAWPGLAITCYDPGHTPYAAPVSGSFDAVIATDMLEHVPEEDVPWVLDELFSLCSGFLYLVAACFPARKHLPDGQNAHCTVMSPEWWQGQVEAAARRYAATRGESEVQKLHWTLCTREKSHLALEKRKGPFRPGIKSRYFEGTTSIQ